MWQSFRDGWHAVVLVASGPSLTNAQIEIARAAHAAQRVRSIVINDNYLKWPDADVLYACDERWWREHIHKVRAKFTGLCVTQDHTAAAKYGLHWVRSDRAPGLTRKVDVIHLGGNSLHQAMNWAFTRNELRPQTQILIGADMKRGPKSREHPRGILHWFGEHPAKLNRFEPTGWIPGFNDLASDCKRAGVRVINCSIDTALTCFERADLAATLAAL